MYKIPKTAVSKWDKWQGNLSIPKAVRILCPHCNKAVVAFPTWKTWNSSGSGMNTQAQCPICEQTVDFWMLIRGTVTDPRRAGEVTDVYMDPDPMLSMGYDKQIDEISPDFGIIYRQAVQAEMSGLDTLVGIGYRKAIEFLLKDWAISEHPDERDKIAKMSLIDCVRNYIQDPSLRNGFERVVWLGNDETHYEKVWKDKDVDDLKRLLEASLHKLSCELELKLLSETMPYKRK